MKCLKCGLEVPSDSSFCQYCGTEIPQAKKCAYCGAELTDDMKFCAMCGRQVATMSDIANKPSNPASIKKKNSGCSISKKLFAAVSCVCAIAVVCACIFGYIAIYNYNSAESWKAEVEYLENELERAETGLAIAQKTANKDLEKQISSLQEENERLADRISKLNENIAANEEMINFIDEYIVFIEDDGTELYHKYSCYRFVGDSFYALNINWAETEGYKPCPRCH